MFHARYRGTEAISRFDTPPGTIVENNSVLDGKRHLVGYLDAHPFDVEACLKDLARISAIRGELGEVIADLEEELLTIESNYPIQRAKIYVSKAEAVRNKIIDSKSTDEAISNLVRIDPAYKALHEEINTAKRAVAKFKYLQDGLFGIENAIKKILDHFKAL